MNMTVITPRPDHRMEIAVITPRPENSNLDEHDSYYTQTTTQTVIWKKMAK